MSSTHHHTRRARRWTRVARWAAVAGVLATSGVACGIRPTDVPVDAGPAPSKASCEAPAQGSDARDIFLVCGSRLASVPRAVELSGDAGDRTAVALGLLAELQATPAQSERAVGFGSEVPDDLTLAEPVPDGAAPVLRLSEQPGQLPVFALAQIICTFAEEEALGTGDSVVLAGPRDTSTSRPQRYGCDVAMRESPESAPTMGRSLPG